MQRILVTLLLITFVAIATADDKPARTHYVVGVEDISYYPFLDFRSENRQGYLSEVMEHFGEELGLTFSYVPLPINRFQYWYEEHQIDFRLPDSPDWNTDIGELIFSDGIIDVCAVTVVLAKDKYKPMAQFRSLGTILGFTPTRYWSESIETGQVTLVQDSSPKVLANMLEKGFVDGLDLTYSSVLYQMGALGKSGTKVEISASVPAYQLAYSLSTKKHAKVITQFNAFLSKHYQHQSQFTDRYQVVTRDQCQSMTVSS